MKKEDDYFLVTLMQTAQIDLSGLANGVYFVKAVVDGNTIAARKVIKNQ